MALLSSATLATLGTIGSIAGGTAAVAAGTYSVIRSEIDHKDAKQAAADKKAQDDAFIAEEKKRVLNEESMKANTQARDLAKNRQKKQILGAQGRNSTSTSTLGYSPGKTLLGD